jgi:hypothetical protein
MMPSMPSSTTTKRDPGPLLLPLRPKAAPIQVPTAAMFSQSGLQGTNPLMTHPGRLRTKDSRTGDLKT